MSLMRMTKRNYGSIAAMAALGLLLIACRSEAPDQPREARVEADLTIADESDRMLEQAVDAARHDLAERQNVSIDRMVVQEARRVIWRDSSLGCPQPTDVYAQRQVPGMLIRLIAEGQEYRYHAGPDGSPFFCPSPRAGEPVESATQ